MVDSLKPPLALCVAECLADGEKDRSLADSLSMNEVVHFEDSIKTHNLVMNELVSKHVVGSFEKGEKVHDVQL